ncbi:hypothetical protein VTN77DRAFT_6292 [Rasamsonia byssochlamydoides]|uniref:uncharacterized protein n=1 Tax=Rasamsonia byssochlamydoides TaxID=89139 RepID=UPI00374333A0
MSDPKRSEFPPPPPPAQKAPRVATVDDMIEWLRWDGWYRGIVGWCTEYSEREVLGPGEDDPDCNRFAPVYPPGTWRTLQRDFDLNAGLRAASHMEEHEKYIRRMIESHKKLLVEAIEDVDRRLVQAGLSVEDEENAEKRASSVYAKLQQLEEAKRKHRPDPRVRIQVICHAGGADTGYEPVTLDLYIPKTCVFEEFEEILERHAHTYGMEYAQRYQHTDWKFPVDICRTSGPNTTCPRSLATRAPSASGIIELLNRMIT